MSCESKRQIDKRHFENRSTRTLPIASPKSLFQLVLDFMYDKNLFDTLNEMCPSEIHYLSTSLPPSMLSIAAIRPQLPFLDEIRIFWRIQNVLKQNTADQHKFTPFLSVFYDTSPEVSIQCIVQGNKEIPNVFLLLPEEYQIDEIIGEYMEIMNKNNCTVVDSYESLVENILFINSM